MLASPAIALTAAVTMFAALICLGTAMLAARIRRKYRISPPAMTGVFEVECALRVQGNTVEQIVIFLPLLWVAALYFRSSGLLVPLVGLIWCVGRVWYVFGYLNDPRWRLPGFAISILALLVLAVLGAIGIVQVVTVA
jgi:uncharacterized membrane protein YecN with MAPEG domain